MQEVFEKIIERLEEEVKYQNEQAEEEPPFCELTFEEARQKMAECYEHAIEIVNQVAEEYEGKFISVAAYKQVSLERDIAIEQLDRLEEKINNGWIPCSERLPENDNNVNVTIIKEYLGKIETATAYYRSDNGKWYICEKDDYDFLYDLFKVIAWQPLPEPYKENQDD